MNEFADVFLFRMGQASAFLAVAAVIAWSILHALRCQSPFVHRTVWCLVLAQSLLIIQLPIAIPWKTERSIASALGENDVTVGLPDSTNVAADNQAYSADFLAVEIPPWTFITYWPSIVFVVWSAGVLAILGRWGMRYVWFVRNLPCRKCENDSWNQEWDAVQAERNIAPRIPLYVSDRAGPMLCRWPDGQRVVVPKALWSRLPREQRQAILCHELAHLERNDLLKTLIANLVAAVHWFNPLAWFAVRRFEDSIEWTCDRIVLASKPDAKVHYAKALLALGNHSPVPTKWASAVFGGGLANRIRRVVSSDGGQDSLSKVLITLGFLVGLLVVHVVRVELVAQEENEPLKNIISTNYFIAPVVTDLQKWDLRGISKQENETVSVYAHVNGRSFLDKQKPTLDLNRFDFDSFNRDLAIVRSNGKDGLTAICIEFENIGDIEMPLHEIMDKVEASFRIRTKESGIENIKLMFTNVGSDWRKLSAELAIKPKESRLGNAKVIVFRVETALSRYLLGMSSANGKAADCIIDVATVHPNHAKEALNAEDKEVIRTAISELKMRKGSSALLTVYFEKPQNWDNIQEQIPQTKKESEFQRDAAKFLKSLGFEQVAIHVDVNKGVKFTSLHD
jgi:beta-lactamase regulating signal transducer with metallopeptidase domain